LLRRVLNDWDALRGRMFSDALRQLVQELLILRYRPTCADEIYIEYRKFMNPSTSSPAIPSLA